MFWLCAVSDAVLTATARHGNLMFHSWVDVSALCFHAELKAAACHAVLKATACHAHFICILSAACDALQQLLLTCRFVC